MLKVIRRRLVFAIPLMAVVATISFFLVTLIPGDPARVILGEYATDEDVATLRVQLGLDKPIPVQFLVWLGQIVRGEFGNSLVTQMPVWDAIKPSLPVTFTVAVLATLFSFIVGLVLGVLAVVRGGVADKIVRVIAGVLNALPSFWFAVLLVLLIAIWVPLLPAVGWVPFAESPTQWAKSLVLPVVSVGAGGAAVIARQARAALLTTLSRDYVRTLLAAGVSRRSVLYKHALRNAAAPVLTVLGFQFIALLGGAVIIESVFALPGLGSLVIRSIQAKDIPVIQAIVMLSAVIVLVVNLVIDLAYAWLNPKVRT